MDAKVIVFANQKGGVGKTTSSQNIAILLAKKGHKTLLIDLDSQGSLTMALGINKDAKGLKTVSELFRNNRSRGEDAIDVHDVIMKTHVENLDLIPANSTLAGAALETIQVMNREQILGNKLASINEEYEYIVVDTAPSTDVITINAFAIADDIIIPARPNELDFSGYEDFEYTLKDTIDQLNPEINVMGLIVNQFRENVVTEERILKQYKEREYPVLTVLNYSEDVKRHVREGLAIVETSPNSTWAKKFDSIAEQIINK